MLDSHTAPYGMGLLFGPAMLPVLPTPHADLSPIGIATPGFPSPPTVSRAACIHACTVVGQILATTLGESGNGPLFFITRWITRGFGAAYPIMRTHNARAMRKHGGFFSPFVRRHYAGRMEQPEEYVEYSSLLLYPRFVDTG